MSGHRGDTVPAGVGGFGTGVADDAAAVTPIDAVADPRWDDFVRSHPGASAYHLSAWARILEAAYGFRPAYLALATAAGELRGVLPVMRTRGLVTGRRLRSLPVVPPAGPLAHSRDGARALLEAACRLADVEDARVWTVHTRGGDCAELVPELRVLPKHPTYVLALDGDPDAMRAGWKKTSNNLFRSLRKSHKAGVTVREGKSEADLRAFYALYLRTMRRRTSPPRPLRQLVEDRRLLGPDGVFRLFLAEHEGDIVAGGVYHAFGDAVDLLYNGSDDARLDVRPNHALYWHAIAWAAQNGFRKMDFGHAKPESSLARFKAQWGAEPVPEHRFDYVPGAAAPHAGDDAAATSGSRPLHGRGRRGAIERVWTHLPLGVTRAAATLGYRWL